MCSSTRSAQSAEGTANVEAASYTMVRNSISSRDICSSCRVSRSCIFADVVSAYQEEAGISEQEGDTIMDLASRVEQRFLEIEQRLRGHGMDAGNGTLSHPEARAELPAHVDYMDEKIERYEHHLNEAYKNAPCQGCKKLVESAIVGVRIFKLMEKDNLKRENISDDDIQRIKNQVKMELGT